MLSDKVDVLAKPCLFAQAVPEVKAGEAVHKLLELLRGVESLQAVGLDDLLQLGHQALLRCRVAATATWHHRNNPQLFTTVTQ